MADEALSVLRVATGSRTQEDWACESADNSPLDEQTPYYPEAVKDASESLRNSARETKTGEKPARTQNLMTKASGEPEAFEAWSLNNGQSLASRKTFNSSQ